MNAMTTAPQCARPVERPKVPTYDARDLIPDGVQACVVLDNQTYYLRITRAGKLILTK